MQLEKATCVLLQLSVDIVHIWGYHILLLFERFYSILGVLILQLNSLVFSQRFFFFHSDLQGSVAHSYQSYLQSFMKERFRGRDVTKSIIIYPLEFSSLVMYWQKLSLSFFQTFCSDYQIVIITTQHVMLIDNLYVAYILHITE